MVLPANSKARAGIGTQEICMFTKATKSQAKARVALIGPSGSGKTYTALVLAKKLAGGHAIAVIDSERGSASKYSDEFDFDVMELNTFEPERYVKAIQAAGDAGYAVLVIDSLSHAWSGIGGALEQVDKAKDRSYSKNSFDAWRSVTPMHNALVDAILSSKCHIVATMRVKTEYVIEKNENGKNVPRKVGLAPVQRDGMEYEFDVVADIDADHKMIVTKSRCRKLSDAVITKPKADDFNPLVEWLSDGAAVQEKPAVVVEAKPTEAKQPAADSEAKARLRRVVCQWANVASDDPGIGKIILSIANAADVKFSKPPTDNEFDAVAIYANEQVMLGKAFAVWQKGNK
jgi:hypothetical protein